MKTALSIDIGGTSTKLAMVDVSYKILESHRLNTKVCKNEVDFFEVLFHAIMPLLQAYPKTEGIGIGAPSCRADAIVGATNLPFPQRVEIVKILETKYALPTFLIKDGSTAALGEGLFGLAQGMRNYVVLTLGTGLGCGIVLNNEVVRGSNGQAGELAHAVIKENGRACKCGKNGCLETYVSATGIKRTVFQLMADSHTESSLRNISFSELTAKAIFEAAKQGDLLALAAFDYTGKILGRKIAELGMTFEPEGVILAGGLASAGAFLLQPTIAQMEQDLLPAFQNQIKVLTSSLDTNEAALLGAASLVFNNVKERTGLYIS